MCYRAYIKVRIIDDEEYEKNETFYIELGEPRLVRTGSGMCCPLVAPPSFYTSNASKVYCQIQFCFLPMTAKCVSYKTK